MGDLASTAEIVGAIAAIAGLFYVGFQIRQSTRATRAATRQSLSDQLIAVIGAYATDEEVARQTWRWMFWEGELPPSPDPDQPLLGVVNEFPRVSLLVLRSVRQRENVFLQAGEEVVDASIFDTYGWSISPLFTTPLFAAIWPTAKTQFSAEFVLAFERLLEDSAGTQE